MCVVSHLFDGIDDQMKKNVSRSVQWWRDLLMKGDRIQKNKPQCEHVFHKLSKINLLHILKVLDIST